MIAIDAITSRLQKHIAMIKLLLICISLSCLALFIGGTSIAGTLVVFCERTLKSGVILTFI
jgi:hypothetical protein